MPAYEPTLDGAHRAATDGKLIDWCCSFLNGSGANPKLAVSIRKRSCTARLECAPLQDLKRIMGPEPDMPFREPVGIWYDRVAAIVNAVVHGAVLPPLIVTDFWDGAHISDGSHRWEAYRWMFRTHDWVVFIEEKR